MFDAFTPKPNTSARNIWSTAKGKVERQAKRILINLDDWKGSMDDFRKQFGDWKIDSMEELIIIKDGKIEHLFPF